MKVRRSSRAILLNNRNEIFLFKFEFAMLSEHKTLWVTPGGGVEANESFEQALQRELHEELGIKWEGPCQYVYFRNKPFTAKSSQEFLSEERYYLLRLGNIDVSFDNMTHSEKKLTKDWKWWSIDDIKNSSEAFFADNLGQMLDILINGNMPDAAIEI